MIGPPPMRNKGDETQKISQEVAEGILPWYNPLDRRSVQKCRKKYRSAAASVETADSGSAGH